MAIKHLNNNRLDDSEFFHGELYKSWKIYFAGGHWSSPTVAWGTHYSGYGTEQERQRETDRRAQHLGLFSLEKHLLALDC